MSFKSDEQRKAVMRLIGGGKKGPGGLREQLARVGHKGDDLEKMKSGLERIMDSFMVAHSYVKRAKKEYASGLPSPTALGKTDAKLLDDIYDAYIDRGRSFFRKDRSWRKFISQIGENFQDHVPGTFTDTDKAQDIHQHTFELLARDILAGKQIGSLPKPPRKKKR
jgi:hypothetical protein